MPHSPPIIWVLLEGEGGTGLRAPKACLHKIVKKGLKLTGRKCTRTKDTQAQNIENWWVRGTSETCEFFGVSPETLSNWARRGAPKAGYGKWDLRELVRWKYAGDESAEMRKLAAEADLKEAKAAQEAIKLAVTEGRYVPSASVTADLRRLFGVLKKSLLAIGHNAATEINAIDPEAAVLANKIIDDSIHDALEQLARSGIYERKA